jgi:hypothetical protein
MKQKIVAVGTSIGGLSALAAALASFCCTGPVILTLIGATGVTASTLLGPYRVYILAGSLVLLGISFWRLYRPQPACDDGSCPPRAGRVMRAVLWCSLALWAASAALYAAPQFSPLPDPEGRVAEHSALVGDADPLREAFNADAGKTRVLMLVAPT